MSGFVVYSIPGSPYGRAVLATLHEKGIDFRFAPLTPGANRAEPYLSRHPFGRIPAFEHDGFLLYETQAILRYLDRVRPAPTLVPGDAQSAARMDQLIGICDWYLFQGVGNVIGFQRVVAPKIMGLTPDEEAIAAAMPKAHTVMAELSRLLGNKTYLAADTVTLADLMIAPQLDFMAETPEWAALTAARPNLQDWLARMRERESMQATTWERVATMAKAA